jgi:pimeloyl-ACP methyl ester carboxylesterase
MRPRLLALIGIGIAAAVGGTAWWAHTPDLPREALEARYLGSRDAYVQVPGIRLRVRDSGPREAPAVLLLHGFGASLETWEGWAAGLADRFRVVRVDLPGFGLTGPDPTGDYSDTRSVAVLAALLDALGIARASLVGNSLGGRIAWRFATAHPDRVERLVLVAPDGFESKGFEYGKAPDVGIALRLMRHVLPRPLVRMSLAPAYGDPSVLTDALLDRYRDLMRAPGVRAAMIARLEQSILEDPRPALARIGAPTLLVWGTKDAMIPVANAQDYRRAMPDARLVEFPALGHVPHEEAPAESLPPVRRFLEGG